MNTAEDQFAKKAQIAAASNALLAILDKPVRVVPSCGISKSKFIAGMQCPKRLYLQMHCPHLAKQTNRGHLDTGVQIGVLARKLFPGGVLVDADANHLADAVRITRELINNSQVPAIFEATFTCDGVLVRVDVLHRKNVHQFRVIEVKSTTSVKPYHLWDVSIQTYVLRGAGVQISSNHLLHVNPEYTFDGELNISKLFVADDISQDRLLSRSAISEILNEQYGILSRPEPPKIETGIQCESPYRCEFYEYC